MKFVFCIVLVHVVYGELGFYTFRGADVQWIILPLWKIEDESDFDQRRLRGAIERKEEKPKDWMMQPLSNKIS